MLSYTHTRWWACTTLPDRLIGRTTGFGPVNLGSSPSPAALSSNPPLFSLIKNMLKRIKKILQVGGIKKLVGCSSIDFKKIAIVFGLNAYGKTTLANILHAINRGDVESIKRLKSLLGQEEQEIDFSFLKNSGEESIIFKDGVWGDNFQKGNILVFDNDFIHRNLIAGVKIKRENKIGFSSFIFGEEGVKGVKRIEKDVQNLSDMKKLLKVPDYVSNEKDRDAINHFVGLKVIESKEVLEGFLLEEKKKLRNIDSAATIQTLPDMKKIGQEDVLKIGNVEEVIKELNEVLDKDYTSIIDEVLNLVESHIKHKVRNGDDDSKKWIAEGATSYLNFEDCPFCGQSLKSVSELMQAYNDAFDNQYKIFLEEVEKSLEDQKSKAEQFSFIAVDNLSNIIQDIGRYQKYDESINTDSFKNDEIMSIIQELNSNLSLEKESMFLKINQKLRMPHSKVTPFSFSESFNEKLEQARLGIFLNVDILNKIIEKAIQLKKDLPGGIQEINRRKVEIERNIKNIEMKIERLKQDNACKNYKQTMEDVNKLSKKIEEDKRSLEEDQSQYVKDYFDKLDENYKRLGNGSFSLSPNVERRGNVSVCTVIVKLNNSTLSNEQIPELMSDSEKRSLAFAVFLTKLHFEEEKEKKIIVLDDSVISFDDNRITNTILLLKEISNEFRQMIFFTHYKFFITELCKQFVNASERSILELKKGANNQISLIERNKEYFTQSEIDKSFKKLYSFANGGIDEDVSSDIRVYIENVLKTRFQKQITDKGIQHVTLGVLISKLCKEGVIDSKTGERLSNFNLAIRGDHHEFSNQSIEDKRNFVNDVLRFCSEDLNKQ